MTATVFHYSHAGLDFEWNWSKTINVFSNGNNIDVFSLDYTIDHTPADAIAAIHDWTILYYRPRPRRGNCGNSRLDNS